MKTKNQKKPGITIIVPARGEIIPDRAVDLFIRTHGGTEERAQEKLDQMICAYIFGD